MSKSEGGRLEHVAHSGMSVRFVAIVRWYLLVQERWQILVCDDVLQASDHYTSCSLENLFITPISMLATNALRYHIVPTQEQNGKGEQGWILVGSRITQNCNSLKMLLTFHCTFKTNAISMGYSRYSRSGLSIRITCGTGLLNSGTRIVFFTGIVPCLSVRSAPSWNERIAFSHASDVL